MSELTHLTEDGSVHIGDIGDKGITRRLAIAEGFMQMRPATLAALETGRLRKGDALAIARIAGIMAAKRTAELIPLCHTVALTHLELDLALLPELPGVRVRALTETRGRTGVEMEALMAVQVALLTLYDMCKGLERTLRITDIMLIHKSGGRSGTWDRDA